jgi:energy-coupling factor transport system substrate-specific component
MSNVTILEGSPHVPVWKKILWILAATAANYLLNQLFEEVLRFPLFLDTVFTIAVTFAFGGIPGLVTAALTTVLTDIIRYKFWGTYLYMFCSFSAVGVTVLFMRKSLLRMPEFLIRFASLFLLSIVMCFVVSLTGALINMVINALNARPLENTAPVDEFTAGLLRSGFSTFAANFAGRLPVNLVDRPLSVFAAYGTVKGLERAVRDVKALPAK